MAKRIQRKRTKGWKMPEGALAITRPGKWGNPFRVGGYFKIGNGGPGFAYLQCLVREFVDSSFTLIETPAQAVEFYNRYLKLYPPNDIAELRGKDLACFCPLDQPCHGDVLLEIANQV